MPYPILGFIITVPVIVIGAIAMGLGGMFVGAQIDDKIEKPAEPIKDIPSVIKWPLIIGGVVFTVIIAKKLSKKVLK